MKKLFAGMVLVLNSSNLLAGSTNDALEACTPVLSYTGQETHIMNRINLSKQYTNALKARAASFNFTVPDSFNLGYGSSGNDAAIKYSEKLDYLYSRASTSFQPAIDAWSSCIQAAIENNGIKILPRIFPDRTGASITLSPMKGSNPVVTGIGYSEGITCTEAGTGETVGMELNKEIEGTDVMNIECRKSTGFTGLATIGVYTVGGSHIFTIPVSASPERKYDEANAEVLAGVTGCEAMDIAEARPYDRTVKVAANVRGKWPSDDSVGNINVTINGNNVISKAVHKGPGMNPRGNTGPNYAFNQTIKAFEPIVLEIKGWGEHGWECLGGEATIHGTARLGDRDEQIIGNP